MKRFAAAAIFLLWRQYRPTLKPSWMRRQSTTFRAPSVQLSAIMMDQLAQFMANDVDFVVVGATWQDGKADFEKYHTRLLSGRSHDMKLEPLQIAVRFLHPDAAIVHWSWTGAGDRNPDGAARKRRYAS